MLDVDGPSYRTIGLRFLARLVIARAKRSEHVPEIERTGVLRRQLEALGDLRAAQPVIFTQPAIEKLQVSLTKSASKREHKPKAGEGEK